MLEPQHAGLWHVLGLHRNRLRMSFREPIKKATLWCTGTSSSWLQGQAVFILKASSCYYTENEDANVGI